MVGPSRNLRRLSLAALVLLAFGAGWGTRTWMQSPTAVQTVEGPIQPPSTAVADASDPESLEQADNAVDLSAFIAERAKLATDVNSYEHWRNSGNQQLLDRNDLVGAVRSYRRALNVATPAQLQTTDKNETWLMSELKYDRLRNLQEELPHADESL